MQTLSDTAPDLTEQTNEWYKRYYCAKGCDRNDLLFNDGVPMQVAAAGLALNRALSKIRHEVNRETAKILYVGGGDGLSLCTFLMVGFRPENMTVVDIQPDRVALGQQLFPSSTFMVADGSQLPFANASFDMIFESTMFCQITDAGLRQRIAGEMLRCLKPQGHVVLRDWSATNPMCKHMVAINKKAVSQMFGAMRTVARVPGALVPPVGRFLSAYAEGLYFPVRSLMPFLTGMHVTVLKKAA